MLALNKNKITNGQAIIAKNYSRFIGNLKIILPIIVLILIAATIILPLLQNSDEPSVSIENIKVKNNDLDVTAPTLSGSDDHARPYKISAAKAIMNKAEPDLITLYSPAADFTNDNTKISAIAAQGLYNVAKKILNLSGNVTITTADGYSIKTVSADVFLATSEIIGKHKVEITNATGTMRADNFTISNKGQVATFNGAVHMVINPNNAEAR